MGYDSSGFLDEVNSLDNVDDDAYGTYGQEEDGFGGYGRGTSAEDVYYSVNSMMSEIGIIVKKINAEDRHMTQIQITKIRDMLDQMDALYGEIAEG